MHPPALTAQLPRQAHAITGGGAVATLGNKDARDAAQLHRAGKKIPFFKMKQLSFKNNSGKYHRLLKMGWGKKCFLLIINHLSKAG
ncbi:MAG: hypothetical protein JZU50_10855 [Desulfobulbaceae bacterium]|jgi:hypothetical protein|nr:hypothetical protein [Desulfobulbaceae bacterium]